MQWWIGPHRFVEALCLAMLIEEGILMRLVDKEVELEITSWELHTTRNGCPFEECDRLAAVSAIGQRIATDDVFL